MTGTGIILKTLLIDKNLSVEEVSRGTEIPKDEIQALIDGKSKLFVEQAIKIGEFFSIPAEFLFTDSSLVNHNNIGQKSNSNSGFIGSYYNSER
jgi:plasmid maintenance system antidote protein VapI